MNEVDTDVKMERGLKNRHIQLIALGGAIGTGLFYGSSETIKMAGPAIVLSYLLGGIVTYFTLRALGEMSVDNPVSGSFSYYAYKNWGEFSGFFSGRNYWFNYIDVSMAELSVIGIYVNYWFPSIPSYISALVSLVIFTLINVTNVKYFGEFEFWFALIKVLAIILMILFGLFIILFNVSSANVSSANVSSTDVIGFSNLWIHGGFFPNGFLPILLSLSIVVFSFGGIELIGITAGEASDPKKSIPKAINQVLYRILIFYIAALLIIMSIFPWNLIGGVGSPFVSIFTKLGIPAASSILNMVVLTACLSTYNSCLYSNGRMLYGLALQGNAPKIFAKLGRSKVPVNGVLFSSLLTSVTVILTYLGTKKIFYYLVSVATFSAVINWCLIIITQIKFRKNLEQTYIDKLEFKMPFYPYSNYVCLIFYLVVVVMMGFIEEMRVSLIIGPLWVILLYVAYKIKRSQFPA
ncbi:MAG: amino acid permease [Oligoflexia bacterium]|nr:amino acid permease [Oligoflexia bacterium]